MLLKESVIESLLDHSRRPRGTTLRGPEDLAKSVHEERARADRSGGRFSLLTLRSAGSASDRRVMAELAAAAQGRMRLSDSIGRGNGCEVWLVMPNCSAGAAERLGQELTGKFASQATISHEVFHYAATEHNPGHRRADLAAGGHAVRRGLFPAESGRQQHEPVQSSVSIRPMEPLFVKSTPAWKRILDAALATLALVLLSPLLAAVALAIKLTSRGPVLFSQLRTGRSGQPFRIYKFRSMVTDAEAQKRDLRVLNEQDGPAFKMEKDPRITGIGHFLRATSIDELPQLWNVLRGEMSLVGPRPLPVDEAAGCEAWQQERLDVTPGLTCVWQVQDRRAKIPFAEWMRLDIRYARARSPLLDLALIAQTFAFVLKRKGV
jgi:lipopolysaccharide/colanic/teichoic acid biosynthesis glycosyltransferase